ncbi:hypothetical protein [Streptomyces roseochromogenus]|uniref:Secreted protein n=1 Tax=Streptomyces roseochromogenus subsp. oscitans DS 12.976 TaxID=1352936 RepID=V6JZ32_STRRC|nr:hypothetical protein [Streptomyces roseochromogenus]EST25058.1 hypothetical protein M878_29620 [Streptomyces roseochromogenus subsp. oscitans DS 12.976]
MFTRQKIATVTGLVGSLAVICVGAAHAHIDGPGRDCRTTAMGDTICVHKSQTRIDQHGKHVIKQAEDCSVVDRSRLMLPDNDLLGGGSKKVGPVVNCSNEVKLPKGFKKPHFAKPHIGF